MADYDPEAQPDLGWNEDGDDDGPDEPQSATQDSDSNDSNQQLQAASVANGDSEDAADYDPESVSLVGAVTGLDSKPLKPSPQPAGKKRKTAGGFLVGDSDDSENEDASAPSVQPPATKPLPQSPVQIHNGAAQKAPSPVLAQPAEAGADLDGPKPSHASVVPPIMSYDPIPALELRVKEDPRGAIDAWLSLLAAYHQRNNIQEIRGAYERFLAVFPHAADMWVKYLEMELNEGNFVEAEALFGKSLMSVPNVQLWTVYLDYIRRRNDLNDPSGQARKVVTQAYEFVIDNVGIDRDAGKIWSDYIQFIRLAPGTIGGTAWQDQQKMDQLRKAFQRAVCMPISNVNSLWREYDLFEKAANTTNSATSRKFVNERSPAYMTAKSANMALDNVTRNLVRSSFPRLPPAPGFEGDVEFAEQLEIWQRWIKWEKEDRLDLANDEPELLKKRILYTYRQAIMALRFCPEIWVDAAEWCFENSIVLNGKDAGLAFLTEGIEANSESVLLALKHADRIETTYPIDEGDEAKIARGNAVKAPYIKVLDTLYAQIKTVKEREKAEIARIRESAPQAAPAQKSEDDDDGEASAEKPQPDENQELISGIEKGFAAQTDLLGRTVSFVWIALARAMRRIQGKGNQKLEAPLGGMRQVFTLARLRGRLSSDVYIAMAQLEWTVYKDISCTKIYERGAKLFPEDEHFMLEYLRYLHAKDDTTNARVVFETCVNRLTQKPALVHKAKPLYSYFHQYSSRFGELSQTAKLEKRMAELFPEDPQLAHFTARFGTNARIGTDEFNPITARFIISPAAQLRPKLLMPSIESNLPVPGSPGGPRPLNSPRPQFMQPTNSPKRPFPIDDFDDSNPPPKKIQRGDRDRDRERDQRDFQRGESPLKGAAGRRLENQRRMHGHGHGHGNAGSSYSAPAPSIPRDITFLLSQLPNAESYNTSRLNSALVMDMLRDTHVPDYPAWKTRQEKGPSRQNHGRQVSTDFASHGHHHQGRDSPSLIGRTNSPFSDARRQLASASATYQQRPASRDSYEPPPVQPYAPPPQGYEGAPTGAWPPPPQLPYGATAPAHGYGAPPQQLYQQPAPQQSSQPPYGSYRY
ncbi:hypothetical protein RB601_005509 [Gaeumannomyces tritici]